jgi:hypothetical protein
MFEALAQFVMGDHLGGHSFEPPLGPTGYARLLAPHRKPYATATAPQRADLQRQALASLLRRDRPARAARSPMFGTHTARAANIGAVYAFVAEVMATRSSDAWIAALDAADIPSRACTAPTACSTTRTCARSASIPSSSTRAKAAYAPSRRSGATAPRPPLSAGPAAHRRAERGAAARSRLRRRAHRRDAGARRHAAAGPTLRTTANEFLPRTKTSARWSPPSNGSAKTSPPTTGATTTTAPCSRTRSTAPSPRAAGSASPCPRRRAARGSASPKAALMMRAISASGAGMSGASSVHMNIFGLNPVVVFGTEEQRQRFLPPLIAGTEKACFAVTEPDAGLDTTQPQDAGGAQAERQLPAARPQDLDLDRAGGRPHADPHAHHAAGPGEEAHAGPHAVLHAAGPQQGRGARDPQARATPESNSSTSARATACRTKSRWSPPKSRSASCIACRTPA